MTFRCMEFSETEFPVMRILGNSARWLGYGKQSFRYRGARNLESLYIESIREPESIPDFGSESIPEFIWESMPAPEFICGFILGSIPPNNVSPKNTIPPATIKTPKGCAMRWLSGSVFSAKMMRDAVNTRARFIIPNATSPIIKPTQQPRQSTPCNTPSRSVPAVPGVHLCMRKIRGLLQRAWQLRLREVN